MNEYITVSKPAEVSFEEKKSVFIGNISPVKNEEDAVLFVNSIRKKYPDAKHNVYAYILRENSAMRYSDDKEPQGTAGLPVLNVMRKNNITDAAIVVTRYFGGILLGTGGLMRAYTEAAKNAVETAEICRATPVTVFRTECAYNDYQKLMPLISKNGAAVESADFADNVSLEISLESMKYDVFVSELTEISGGRISVVKICEKYGFTRYDALKNG